MSTVLPTATRRFRGAAMPFLRSLATTIATSCCLLILTTGSATAAGIRLPEAQTLTLDNGARVILVQRKDVPMVAATALVQGGSLSDPDGKEGSAELLAALLSQGAGTRDALAFAQAVDGAGGSLSIESSQNAIVAEAQFLSKDSGLMLSLLADALLRPRMEQTEFDKLRQRAIAGIATAKDSDPRRLIGNYVDAWLFRGHPYGRPTGGDETSLARITLEDLQAFRRSQMGGDRLILVIAGDFDPAAVSAQVRAAFGGWAHASGSLPTISAEPKQTGRRVLLVDKPGATQTYFTFANIGTTRDDPARAAQDIVATAFGGRFTSMLNTELRVKSGLTYGARAGIDRQVQPGSVDISTYTKTDSTRATIDMAIATLDRLHHDGLDAATAQSAKNYIAGQFAPRLETAAQVGTSLAWLTLYGEPRSYIDGDLDEVTAATPEQVAAARAVFPDSKDLVMVVIGDAAKIRDLLKTYGPVTEMRLSDPHFSP